MSFTTAMIAFAVIMYAIFLVFGISMIFNSGDISEEEDAILIQKAIDESEKVTVPRD